MHDRFKSLKQKFNEHQLDFIYILAPLENAGVLDPSDPEALQKGAKALGISKAQFKAYCSGFAQASWKRAQDILAQETHSDSALPSLGLLMAGAGDIVNTAEIALLLGGKAHPGEKTMRSLKIESSALSAAAAETLALILQRCMDPDPNVVALIHGNKFSDALPALVKAAGYAPDDDAPFKTAGFESWEDFKAQYAAWVKDWTDQKAAAPGHTCCGGGCLP